MILITLPILLIVVIILNIVDGYFTTITPEIALYCKNLQYINLKGCKKITNIGILEIVRQCRNLKSLECKKLTDDNMIEISQLLPSLSITMGMR
jgi:hypothetical protein